MCLVATATLAAPPIAGAQTPGETPLPIPQDPLASGIASFVGSPAATLPVRKGRVPRHPFMAPNGRSNIHDDAYQSDTYRHTGPIGDGTTTSALFLRECASITFDSHGRLVSVCVGLDKPVLAMLDPRTLHVGAAVDLPMRSSGPSPFQDFSGGGYFYLDNRDRAVVSAGNRHVIVVAETGGTSDPGFRVVHDYDLTAAVPSGDALISALPDWHGRIWFASKRGVVGTIARAGGRVRSLDTGEAIGNSFAVDDTGGVFIVTDRALYRFDPRRGRPTVTWRRTYPNVGLVKPGQTERGSGTTPTLIGGRYVAITDNADPMDVLVYRRRPRAAGHRLVCRQPVFRKGASDTDQSLIANRGSIIAENNYGYTGPAATMNGGVTAPGLERVDIDRDGRGCHRVWTSKERAPSAVPKLSLGAGLVYTYTKPERDDQIDAWYLTAIGFRTGKTVWSRLAGTGSATTTTTRRSPSAPTGPPTSACSAAWCASRTQAPETAPASFGA